MLHDRRQQRRRGGRVLRARLGLRPHDVFAPAEAPALQAVAPALEAVVDLHTFDPGELAETARRAGAVEVGTATEELTSAFFGWPVRTIEYAVKDDALGFGWAMFAYRGWQRLMRVDDVLSRVVPQRFYYNVGVTGVKPRP